MKVLLLCVVTASLGSPVRDTILELDGSPSLTSPDQGLNYGGSPRASVTQPVSDLNMGGPGNMANPDLEEGDIVTSWVPWLSSSVTRKGTIFGILQWPVINGKPTVHYKMGSTRVPESSIQNAIAHYEEHTCIRFERITAKFHLGTLIRFEDGDGCSSRIGRGFWLIFGGQPITLDNPGCASLSTIVHEIGHALGLHHEQSRSDRDDHVTVLSDNIENGKKSNFFKPFFTDDHGTDYDFYSVMQYGPLYFSKGKSTLASTDPLDQSLMALPRTGLSFMDKLLVNSMYGCIDKWKSDCSSSSGPCENNGFIDQRCSCVCPAGTSGDKCQVKTMEYNEALIAEHAPLNGKVTTPGIIATPGYPSSPIQTVVFTKLYEAPSCQRVVLTVAGFDLYPRNTDNNRCWNEGVEIRLGDVVTSGNWYCEKELTTGQVLKSEGNTLVLFYSRGHSSSDLGFSFAITFENNPSC